MAKFSLTPSPTFKEKVGIPVAGGAPADVQFVFRHRTKSQLDDFLRPPPVPAEGEEPVPEKTDVERIKEMATGWDLDDPFDDEHIGLLVENYPGAGVAVLRGYVDALIGARRKN
jgi:hypothetical protein